MSKKCSKCGKVKSLNEFYKDKSLKDGHQSKCKKCANKQTGRYEKTKRGKAVVKKYQQSKRGKSLHRKSAARQRAKHPERFKARSVVNNAITIGKKPSPKIYTCLICFKVPAQQYHHHLGYSPEHHLDVIAVCIPCHKKLDKR